jgi:uncharacterized protein (TIGR03382 family)
VTTTGQGFFGFSCHYCNVDDVNNAKILGCSCFAAGFRVWDIHDPLNPKEIAYYKPKGQGTKVLPGSQYANFNSVAPGAAPFSRVYDWTTTKVSFPRDRGSSSTIGDIWITSQDNGFQVLRLYTAVAVSPTTIETGQNQTEKFTATPTGWISTGGVTWAITEGAAGGTIDPDGTYHSPGTAGTYHAVATSKVDPTMQSTVTITVAPHNSSSVGCGSAGGALALGVLGLLAVAFRRRTRRV